MVKKALYLLAGLLMLTFVAQLCICYIPISKTPFDLMLEAVKATDDFDNHGNVLGTASIKVSGTLMKYLFRDDRLELHIAPFDHIYDVRPWVDRDRAAIDIGKPTDYGYYWAAYCASSTITGENSVSITLWLREDLSKWEFHCSPSLYADRTLWDQPGLDVAYLATVK